MYEFCLHRRIYEHYQNIKGFFLGKASAKVVENLHKFLSDQDVWMRQMVENNGKTDPVWRHVGLVIDQYDGLVDGYKSVAPPSQVIYGISYFFLSNASSSLFLSLPLLFSDLPFLSSFVLSM